MWVVVFSIRSSTWLMFPFCYRIDFIRVSCVKRGASETSVVSSPHVVVVPGLALGYWFRVFFFHVHFCVEGLQFCVFFVCWGVGFGFWGFSSPSLGHGFLNVFFLFRRLPAFCLCTASFYTSFSFRIFLVMAVQRVEVLLSITWETNLKEF
jgi:hypothetical protein